MVCLLLLPAADFTFFATDYGLFLLTFSSFDVKYVNSQRTHNGIWHGFGRPGLAFSGLALFIGVPPPAPDEFGPDHV